MGPTTHLGAAWKSWFVFRLAVRESVPLVRGMCSESKELNATHGGSDCLAMTSSEQGSCSPKWTTA